MSLIFSDGRGLERRKNTYRTWKPIEEPGIRCKVD